jgi:hypothetical protein
MCWEVMNVYPGMGLRVGTSLEKTIVLLLVAAMQAGEAPWLTMSCIPPGSPLSHSTLGGILLLLDLPLARHVPVAA